MTQDDQKKLDNLKEKENAMSMFDLTAEAAFVVGNVEPDEKAVGALLKSPAVSYIRDLGKMMEQDPNYLAFHDRSVALRIQNLLSRQGIFWDDEVFERQFLKLVNQAVVRLKYIEK